MRFEALSRPKARDLSTPPDDVLLHVPGKVTAIFDGATDARKRRVNGVPLGRAAAVAAARATAALPSEAAHWPVSQILSELSAAIGQVVPPDTEEGPASTTAIVAFETGQGIRLVGLGDSGVRVNGTQVDLNEIPPDRASIPARVALFQALRSRHDPEQTEVLSQRYLGFGLEQGVGDGAISRHEAAQIIETAIVAANLPGAEDEVAALLSGGLRGQYQFANNPAAKLGYGILNGAVPMCSAAVDKILNRDDVVTLELFSDGYLDIPAEVTVAAWEAAHATLEMRDLHHITEPAAVKGSTSTHFFDDRTIAILGFADVRGTTE